MAGARPRRSVVPPSYRIGFPDLPGSSDEAESDNGEEGEDEAGDGDEQVMVGVEQKDKIPRIVGDRKDGKASSTSSPKKKRRRRESTGQGSDEEEVGSSSGSEYAPDTINDRDGAVLKVAESEDSADLSEKGEPEEDSESVADDEDLDGSIAGSDNLDNAGKPLNGHKQGLKYSHGKARTVSFVSNPSESRRRSIPTETVAPASIRIVGRTPLAILNSIPKKSAPKRKPPTSSANFTKKTPLYDIAYGPAYFPPRFILTRDFDDSCHCPRAVERDKENTTSEDPTYRGLQHADTLSVNEKLFAVKRVAYLPFGPRYDVCEDIGWYKGKWKAIEYDGQITEVRSKRWGGWYEDVPTRKSQYEMILDFDMISPYLPCNLYPALPSAIHLQCASKAPPPLKSEDVDGDEDNWDIGSPGDTGFSSAVPLSNAAEAFSTGTGIGDGTQRIRYIPSVPDQQRIVELEKGEDYVKISMGPLGRIVAGQNVSEKPQTKVELKRFESVRLDAYLPDKPGHMFNAAGPVWGLDWCPQADDRGPAPCEYLAVSTISEHLTMAYRQSDPSSPSAVHRPGLIQIWSLDTTVGSDLATSTSSTEKGRGMRLEVAMLLERECSQIQWCPKGGENEREDHESSQRMAVDVAGKESNLERLGLLATLAAHGGLAIYDVPRVESLRKEQRAKSDALLYTKPKAPLLKLDLGMVPISTFEWASHSMLVAGCSTGHVAVFHIEDALSEGTESVGPTHFFAMHETPITMITVIREPALDAKGRDKLDAEPTRIATSSLDGSTKMVDLQDWGSVFDFGHERALRTTACFQPSTGGILYGDQEIGIRYICLHMRDFGASTRIVSHNGPLNVHIACSDYHSFHASASTDGSCAIGNSVRRLKRAGHASHYLTKMYRVDYNRKTGELRMIDNIVPDSRVNHETRTAARKKALGQKAGANDEEDDRPTADTLSSLAWPPEVAVNRVAWSKSLRRAHLLASGMACGLVRVDITTGPWSSEASVNLKDPPKGALQDDEDDD